MLSLVKFVVCNYTYYLFCYIIKSGFKFWLKFKARASSIFYWVLLVNMRTNLFLKSS